MSAAPLAQATLPREFWPGGRWLVRPRQGGLYATLLGPRAKLSDAVRFSGDVKVHHRNFGSDHAKLESGAYVFLFAAYGDGKTDAYLTTVNCVPAAEDAGTPQATSSPSR